MSFHKGDRQNPGMVVRLGENPRQGRAGPANSANGRSEAKDLIFGEVAPQQPAGRQYRPPLQPANTTVDASTGPPSTMMKSKVGPGRARRQADDSDIENVKRYQEEAIRGFQDARQARNQSRDVQGRQAFQLGFDQGQEDGSSNGGTPTKRDRSLSRRPSRERSTPPQQKQVDPEMAELLGRIEQTAELERVDARASEIYWDAQAAADKSRTRNYRGVGAGCGGIFGEAPEEETLRSPLGAAAMGYNRQPQGPADEARLAREQALMRNRGTEGGIFAKDGPMPVPPSRNLGSDIINHRW